MTRGRVPGNRICRWCGRVFSSATSRRGHERTFHKPWTGLFKERIARIQDR